MSNYFFSALNFNPLIIKLVCQLHAPETMIQPYWTEKPVFVLELPRLFDTTDRTAENVECIIQLTLQSKFLKMWKRK